jgi:hypothetical protein
MCTERQNGVSFPTDRTAAGFATGDRPVEIGKLDFFCTDDPTKPAIQC